MFKLVVLCAFFAAAAAKPDVFIAGPLGGYPTYISPASTTITKQASSVIHPSPLVYNAAPFAYTHFIKKRSPQIPLGYYAPSTTYYSANPLVAPAGYSAPLVHAASILPAASPFAYSTAHLIKKRSAPLLSTSYIAPTTYIAPSTYAATAPLYSTAYTAGAPFITSPLLSQPITYSHFIKKRSAPLLTYAAPAAVSHQSRIDLGHSPLVYSSSVVNPVVYPGFYNSPIYSHVI